MSDLTEVADVLARGDEDRAVVRVLDRHGFGTVEPGQLLVAGADGTLGGVLLRGALDDRRRGARPRRPAGAAGRSRRTSPRTTPWPPGSPARAARRCSATPSTPRRPARSPRLRARGAGGARVARRRHGSLAITGGELDDVEGSLGFAEGRRGAASHVRRPAAARGHGHRARDARGGRRRARRPLGAGADDGGRRPRARSPTR